MSNLYKRIELLCAKKGISITQMCKDCNASRGSLTDLAKGRIKTLSSTTLKKISEYFNVPVDSLSNDVLKVDFVPHYFDNAIITCPICGSDYTDYVRTIGVDLENEKSFCIALEFMCECEHTFYYVIESYKGNSYILKTCENRILNFTPFELPETDNPEAHKIAASVTVGDVSGNSGAIGVGNTVTNNAAPDKQETALMEVYKKLTPVQQAKLLVFADEMLSKE